MTFELDTTEIIYYKIIVIIHNKSRHFTFQYFGEVLFIGSLYCRSANARPSLVYKVYCARS